MIPRLFSRTTCSVLIVVATGQAEIESQLPARGYLLATGHSSPEQIGPSVHHRLDEERGHRFELEISAGADSRYVSEGRDNLAGESGIVWGDALAHVHALGGSLFAQVIGIVAWEADYEELNLTTGYQFELGPVTIAGSATYLRFPEDDSDDVEFALSAEWLWQCGAGLAAEAVWSTEADGWFGEAQLYYELAVCDYFTATPSIFVGANQGYLAGEHDGFNHLGIELEGSVRLGERIEASAYVAFSEPIDERAGENLRDLFWFGGAVTVAF